MGYLTNSGSGFLSNAVTTVSNVKSYLVDKTGYLVDSIRVGIGDFGQRVLDDGGTVEASAEAAASYREITKDIYDQASLVLFPSGYKDNLVYSHKPVDGSGDFTYTRGTDTATRVGADGYIKKERANFLLQSNQFDTTWTDELLGSIISGQSGYDGTNDAWLLNKGEYQYRRILQSLSTSVSGIWTFSVYAKEGTTSIMNLRDMINANRVQFDLSGSGSVSAEFGNISSKIESVGNGWFRCSATFNNTSSSVGIYVGWNDSTASSIYIQDAQLEEGLVATTPYIETTTAPVYEGLTDNLPRIDYTGGTPSILLEPSRQNRLPNSEYFGDWTNTSASFVYNVSNSPQGVKNAIRIIPNSSDFEIKAPVNTAVVSTESTFSVFLKYETGGFEYAVLGSGAPIQRYVFNIAEGTKVGSIGSTSIPDEKASIESYGNGWYRCVVTTNNTGGNKHSIYLSDDGTDIAATGADGTKGMLAWGAQAERENNYATSYIPTYGSSATRSRDLVDNQSLNPVLGDGDLTILYDFNYDVTGREGSGQLFLTFSGTDFLGIKGTQSINRSLQIFSNGGFGNNITFNNSSPYATRHKVLLRITSDIVELFYNGSKHNDTINTNGIVGSYAWDRIKIDATNAFFAELNQVASFNTALTDSECIALTAL